MILILFSSRGIKRLVINLLTSNTIICPHKLRNGKCSDVFYTYRLQSSSIDVMSTKINTFLEKPLPLK
jgi:hypothetical protein